MIYAEVIKHFGSQAAAAKALGIKQPSVAYWKTNGIPYLRQLQIEKLTHGRLKAAEAEHRA